MSNMKKIISFLSILALLTSLVGCSEKNVTPSECDVTIEASIEDFHIEVNSATRALSGEYKLYVGIFQNGTQLSIVPFDVKQDGTANAVISLVTDQVYDLVFWAQGKSSIYNIENLSSITIPNEVPQNTFNGDLTLSEAQQNDVFCAVEKGVNFSGSITHSVKLYRVGGLLNILTPDNVTSSTISYTEVSYTSFTKYNPLTGQFSEEKQIAHKFTFPEGSHIMNETIDGKVCTVLAKSYFFTDARKDREVVVKTFKNGQTEPIKETILTAVPFEKNKRTNLVGSF